MTRKDYVLIAEAINETFRTTEDRAQRDALVVLTETLILSFRADNPNFNPTRFRAAALNTPQEVTA